MKRAMMIGRFQPFHNGHFKALSTLLKRFDEVVLVMGSSMNAYEAENPFTSGERIEMIRSCFNKKDLAKLIIIPVPDINDNTRWVDHVLIHVPQVNQIYSNNNLVKLLFSKAGILVKSTPEIQREKNEGTTIRRMIREGNPDWKKHVPKPALKFLQMIDSEKRIKEFTDSHRRQSHCRQ